MLYTQYSLLTHSLYLLLSTHSCLLTAVSSLLSHHRCLLAAVYPLLSTHCYLLTAIYSLLSTHCCLVTSVYSLLSIHCYLLTAIYSLLLTHCCLLTAVYSLLSTHCCLHTAVYILLSTHCCLLTKLTETVHISDIKPAKKAGTIKLCQFTKSTSYQASQYTCEYLDTKSSVPAPGVSASRPSSSASCTMYIRVQHANCQMIKMHALKNGGDYFHRFEILM